MKLYKQTATIGLDVETKWSGSLADASAQRAAWTKDGIKRADITSNETDVPTDKKGLIEFLNARA